ncbi:hypothetical protein [uncultured Stenotrophomonas sp.]|uniref:hypothetical protein n=1 Tax=uncultured Stenotrophomonas sp. TaxID=165438 RepID=UPI0028E9CC3C|nr:hypothetical protein [uncultured Stenotrophomonas sp.]
MINTLHPLLLRSAAVLPWLGLFASAAMAVIVTAFGLLAMPYYVDLFGAAGQPLPWITQVFSQAWGVAWLAPVLVGAALFVRTTPYVRIAAGVFGLGAGVLGAVSALFAMYLPYFKLASLV